MSGARIFLIPLQFDFSLLRQRLEEHFTIQEIAQGTAACTYLDTFDWRLFTAQMMLSRKGRQFTLAKSSGEVLLTDSSTRKKYPFWWDFQVKEQRQHLQNILEMRAVMPQFDLSEQVQSFALLNTDEKTVLRFRLIHAKGQRGDHRFSLQPVFVVEPLRGYGKQLENVCTLLTDAGLQQSEAGYNLVGQVHDALGVDVLENSSKFSIRLRPNEKVDQAVQDICLNLRAAILRNVPGTLDDIDSEFLHDLRVAVRRTRSLLSLLKKYLPIDVIHFQNELKWVGNFTGPVRDLDVYLLMMPQFQAILPQELHGGLDCFFNALTQQRKRELRYLRANLRSVRFAELLENWQHFFLQLVVREDYDKGKKKCRLVTEKIIRKRFSRILRIGGTIVPESPPSQLHELRIEGKKFRYSLEFFRSLFHDKSVDLYLKQMKKLQNNLGEFNDISVQKSMLVARLAEVKKGDSESLQMAAALGGLIVHLAEQQLQLRTMFEQTFTAFATQENIQLLERIFDDTDTSLQEE